MMTESAPLAPGAVIGILGGGQLGRMLAFAAHRLGYRVHGFCPEPDAPLAQVTNRFTCADYGDEAALAQFAEAVDVVTFEFENVPVAAVDFLSSRVPVRPDPRALAIIQDRLSEKRFLAGAGVPVPPFAPVSKPDDLATAVLATELPAILKTRRFGYDGKGQAPVDSGGAMEPAWEAVDGADSILEAKVAFDRELSVIAGRGLSGETRIFPLTENRHVHHILDTSIAPAEVPESIREKAVAIADTVIGALDYVGVLAIELFLEGETLMVNELAPRVHNSGHWTIEGAVTSQFEQHIRAICGLPLGPGDALFQAEMKNLIGPAIEDWLTHMAEPGVHVHLYGKGEARPGRKMGHVTRLKPLPGKA